MKPRHRLVANLKRLLAPGMRAYAAAPGEAPVEVEANIMAICAAADAGRVKLSLVDAEGARVAIDARHGAIKGAVNGDPGPASQGARRAGGLAQRQQPPSRGHQPGGQGGGGASPPLLRAIGIANADGTVSAHNAKKLKQTRHLVELLRPAWEAALAARRDDRPLRVADLACGNAYLSFVLYDALRAEDIACRLHGIESRPELVKNCEERARTLSFEGMSFATASIRDADLSALGGPPDLVLALHACDTATDEAIALAVRAHAPALFVVPCCHAELARQVKGNTAASPALSRHGLLLNDYATTLTDALRAEILDAAGYAVDVVEFIDAGHTPKNRLIRAHRRTSPAPGRSLAGTLARIAGEGLVPSLARLLGGV
ncbi:MAG: SAM-dependent methyltransferase [Deltaproteobacteria bacterium]|nr:SAM-dependent methyltransferase [Deltaproteobacteria bacterium]